MDNNEMILQNSNQLKNAIEKIINPLRSLTEKQLAKENYMKQINFLSQRIRTENSIKNDSIIISLCIGGGVFVITFFMTAFNLIFILPCLILGGIASFISYKINYHTQNNNRNISINNLQNIQNYVNQLDSEIFNIAETYQYDMEVLPPNYQYSIAAEYIYNCFVNQRANTMAEAINLYEEQLHRWKMENYQQEMLNMQIQQQRTLESVRRNSAVSAGANVASAMFNLASRL